MSLFEETFQEMESFGKEFDTTADKLRILIEYVVADYNVDMKTAQLSAKQDESVTLEAVNEAYDVAYEKCMDKLKKSIGGIKRNSNDYFAKINASITKIVEDPSYQKTIEDASALCKQFPKLGKVDVKYDPYQDEAKAIAGGMDALQKIIAKGKASKKFTEADSKAIDDIVTDVNKKRQAIGKKEETTSLTEAISLLSALMIALKEQSAEKSMEGIDAPIDGMEPDAARIFEKAIGAQKQLAKASAAANIRGALSLRNGIKKASKKSKSIEKEEKMEELKTQAQEKRDELLKKKEEKKAMKESEENEEEPFDASALLESVFASLHKEPETVVPEEEETVEESAEDLESDIQNSLAYMQQLEEEVLGIHMESADYVDPGTSASTKTDAILAEAAAAAKPLNSNPEEKIPEATPEAEKEIEKAVKEGTTEPEADPVPAAPTAESSEDPVEPAVEPVQEAEVPTEDPVQESTDEPVEEEPVEESALDDSDLDFDADALLEQAAAEAGLNENEENDSLEALLESFNKEFGISFDDDEPVEE